MNNFNKSRNDLLHDTQIYSTFYLKAGEVYYTTSKKLVHTILGSCVSVIFFHPSTELSIISHAQLPYKKEQHKYCNYSTCPVDCSNNKKSISSTDLKFVSCSFIYMLKILENFNIPKNQIIVKIFGGANVIPLKGSGITVGEENVKTAYQFIERNNLKLVSSCVGGDKGRTLYLYTETGDVYLNHLTRNNTLTCYIDKK
jgi:chemotaxis protein CheD